MKVTIWLDMPDPASAGSVPLFWSSAPCTQAWPGYRRFRAVIDFPVKETSDAEEVAVTLEPEP